MRSGLERLVALRDGWRVVWAGDSVKAFLRSGAAADVLLLDIELADGEVSSEDVSAVVHVGTQVLVVSALASPEATRRLAALDVAGFVSKTDEPETLASAIDATISGSGWLTPRLLRVLSRGPDTPSQLPPLSPQETRVVELYASGMKVASVARALNLSPHTVSSYLKSAREKFNLVNRPAPTQRDLYQHARELGLIEG